MKFNFIILLFCLTLYSNAQKIAFVNEEKLLKEIPNYQIALKTTDSIKKVFVDEITNYQNELDQKTDALLINYQLTKASDAQKILSSLSEVDKKKYEILQDEYLLLQKKAKQKEEEFNLVYKEKVNPVLQSIDQLIQAYCKQNKIDLLLKTVTIQPAVAYYDENKNMTTQIIAFIKSRLK